MRTPPEATGIKSTRSNVELILENTVSRKEFWLEFDFEVFPMRI
jgi:hypothetical protein